MKTILLFIVLMFITTTGLFLYQYLKFHDGRLHVIFCDVGQGDAVVIRTPEGSTMLLDGGPDQNVLSCLREYLPFWERTIDLMLLTHPHADHLVGLMTVLKRYTVLSFDTEELRNETAMYTALLDLLKKQKTHTRFVLAGDQFRTKDGVTMSVLSPSMKYLKETSPGGTIGEKKEFASLIVQLTYGDFDVLFTGDSQVVGLEDALRGDSLGRLGELGRLGGLDILQSPHHGSRTGLSREMLGKLNPSLVVISVGKNNYGHPSKETLRLLQEAGIKTVRTDKNGNIELISDGKKWWLL